MTRIVIRDDEKTRVGAGVEGRQQKKEEQEFDDDFNQKKSRSLQTYGGLKFDKKKQSDIFESKQR
ncbi:MAG: hypothetical protein D5R96_08650 [Methanocalculus sp. MSAO_Arc2]|uniref:hypothetical protein n=1 Tax=Methanocalculus sp. MSAO_Arc2 TaxID=2293855 RepID=UPI000FF6AB19|nr:MAG: hypothetical protein D5R96_08650 [Methanocalculus sp. MSAO_Arc2]